MARPSPTSSPTWRCRPRAKATTSSNVAAVRRLYELFIDGRVEETKDLLDPDIYWSEPEEAPDRHVVQGVDNALAALSNWLSTWCDYQLDLIDVVAGTDDRVFQAMRQRATGAVSGAPFEADLFQVWWLRDGKPYRSEMFFDRTNALAAAGLG